VPADHPPISRVCRHGVPGMLFTVESRGNTHFAAAPRARSRSTLHRRRGAEETTSRRRLVSGAIPDSSQSLPAARMARQGHNLDYKAEFDRVSSAALVAETKYGTNEFSRRGLRESIPAMLSAETPSDTRRRQRKRRPKNTESVFVRSAGPSSKVVLHSSSPRGQAPLPPHHGDPAVVSSTAVKDRTIDAGERGWRKLGPQRFLLRDRTSASLTSSPRIKEYGSN